MAPRADAPPRARAGVLNYVIIPGTSYGAQLALGALGVTLIYGILRFSNFAHGDTMAFGTAITILITWWFQSMGLSFGPLPTALLALPIGKGELLREGDDLLLVAIGTMVAPAIRQARMPALYPNVWKNGLTMR